MQTLAMVHLRPEDIWWWTWREFLIYAQATLMERNSFRSVLLAAIINSGGPKTPVKPSELNPLEHAAKHQTRKISNIDDLIKVVEGFKVNR